MSMKIKVQIACGDQLRTKDWTMVSLMVYWSYKERGFGMKNRFNILKSLQFIVIWPPFQVSMVFNFNFFSYHSDPKI